MNNANNPIHARTAFDKNGDITSWDDEYLGLTKREYFAGLAMQGILASSVGRSLSRTFVATESVNYADELLKQLEQ